MKQRLNIALKLAAEYHDDQYDRGGNPYLLHVLKVMHYLKTDDEELNCIAVLHDIVEDTKVTLDDLKHHFSPRVVSAVDCLTKKKGQTADQYLNTILSNKDAIRVKMCDLRHNMDIRRLKRSNDGHLSEKDLKRLEKYANMYHRLETELDQ